jgi:hypothetical protein
MTGSKTGTDCQFVLNASVLKCHSEANDLNWTPLSSFGAQSVQLVVFVIDGFAA